ncbi:hypothetical protein DMI65_13770 [Escherichia coli]|nr:hypothetical protein [Escherichia coli]
MWGKTGRGSFDANLCHNDYPETITDYVTLQRGSAYGGVLSSFPGP